MNDLIVKSNYIIEASYKLSLEEQRIIHILTSMINKDDVDFKKYKLTVKEFIKITKTKDKNIYKNVAGYVESLRRRDLTIIKENSILKLNWLSSAEYFDKQGYIELEFSPKLKPYLLQLKESFTKLSREKLISFKSQHTGRVYELLKQYEKIKCREITIEKFKKYLGFEDYEYKEYGLIKQRILTKAKEEINKNSDINVDYEEIKEGRKVIAIKFIIKSNPTSQNKINEVALTTEQDDDVKLEKIQEMLENKISKKDAYSIYINASGDMDKIRQAYEASKITNEDIGSLTAYMIKLVRLEEIAKPVVVKKSSKQNNAGFEQRNYTTKDYKDLEKKLLGWDEVEEVEDKFYDDLD